MDVKVIEGDMVVRGKRFAVVAGRWNGFFGEALVEGAVGVLLRHGCLAQDIEVYRCPGSFEIPQVAARIVERGRADAVICLGVLIRGATPHFDYIASEATKGIAALGNRGGLPVTYGVITCDNLEQAIERSGSKAGNKGAEAALAAIEMVNLYEAIDGQAS